MKTVPFVVPHRRAMIIHSRNAGAIGKKRRARARALFSSHPAPLSPATWCSG